MNGFGIQNSLCEQKKENKFCKEMVFLKNWNVANMSMAAHILFMTSNDEYFWGIFFFQFR